MMNNSSQNPDCNLLLLGYNFDKWYGYGTKEGVYTDISPKTNSHMIICGMSGSGKSYALSLTVARIILLERHLQGTVYFADYKMDDCFSHLRECSHYYPYNQSLEALDRVYTILNQRQSGEDITRYPVTLVWDEYMANILSLENTDKKKADGVKRKIADILMLGRTLSVRLIISLQRGDATAFMAGARLNFGIITIVGAPIKSIYEMLVPKEMIESIGDRSFGTGEGITLLQNAQLEFIKVPMVRNLEAMQQVCIDVLK